MTSKTATYNFFQKQLKWDTIRLKLSKIKKLIKPTGSAKYSFEMG